MKKTLSLILCAIMLFSVVCGLTACNKECKAHSDRNSDAVCDVCGGTVSAYDVLPKDSVVQLGEIEAVKYFGEFDKESSLSNLYTDSTLYWNSNLVIFKNESVEPGETKLAVFNGDLGKVVMTLKMEDKDDDSYTTIEISNNLIIKKTAEGEDDTTYKTIIYTAEGNEIASKTSKKGYETPVFYNNNNYYSNSSLFSFNDKVYEMTDKGVEYMFDLGLRSIPNYNFAGDKYYYYVDSNCVEVYNPEFALVAYYEAPNNAEDCRIAPLADGNIGIQYFVELPDDAAEYDVFDDYKYDVKTIIFNVESKTATEVEVNYYVESILSPAMIGNISDSGYKADWTNYSNIAVIYEIENKTIGTEAKTVNIANNLNVVSVLNSTVPNEQNLPQPIDTDRYIVSDIVGKEYLVKGSGEIIGEVTGATYDIQSRLFKRGDKFYDTDLQLVSDLSENGYTLMNDNGYGYQLYSDLTKEATLTQEAEYKYYIIQNGKFVVTGIKKNATNFYFASNYFYYTYTAANVTYRVYCNANGEEIMKFNTSDYDSIYTYTYGNSIVIQYNYTTKSGESMTDYYVSTLG